MDQATANILQMLVQGMWTGKVGALNQSPDLPALDHSSIKRDLNVPEPQKESSHKKSINIEGLINEIVGTQIARGKADNSLPLTSALSHVPMNWRGRRQSSNVEEGGGKAVADVEQLFNWVNNRQGKPLAARAMFPVRQSPAYLEKGPYPPTQFTPSTDQLLKILLTDPTNWVSQEEPE